VQAFDDGVVEVVGDDDDPRPAIVRRPGGQSVLVDCVLNAMHDEGALRIVIESNQSLQPEHLRASDGLEQVNERGECFLGYRVALKQRHALYANRRVAACARNIVLSLALLG
jgi:hypothetical protein